MVPVMDTQDLRLALRRSAPPRSLEGSAGYLLGARIPFRMGMAGALLFVLPFVAITVTGPNSIEQMIGTIASQLMIWVLLPVLFLRHRMKYIDRLWCEGQVVQGVLLAEHLFMLKNGKESDTGSYKVGFTTPEGQQRSATFLAERIDFPPGQPPLILALDDVPHRAGLVGARHLIIGKVVPVLAKITT